MKKEFTEWQKKVVENWEITYQGILEYNWNRVKHKYENEDLGVSAPEDIRKAFLALFGEQKEIILHSRKLSEWLGSNTIYELLSGTTKEGYTIEEGRDLIKYYLSSFWGAKYK